MIKYLIYYLSPARIIKSRQRKLYSVFTKTLNGLERNNTLIQQEINKNSDLMARLAQETADYQKVYTENQAVYTKIEQLVKP